MARSSRLDFSLGGVQRAITRVQRTAAKKDELANRAVTTLVRRVKPEAARLIAKDVLNLSAAKVSQNLRVEKKSVGGSEYLSVQANRVRLPLAMYTPRFNRLDGVTATTWREKGPQQYPRAFKRKDRAGVWQRVPKRPRSADLVARLPIVERKGPSLHRVFETRGPSAGHGNVIPKLSTFVEQTLSLEIARLLRAR